MCIMMRASTTAQFCGNRFMHSYIIKHSVGQDICKLEKINFNENTEKIEIETRQGANNNEKTTGVHIRGKNSKRKKYTFKNQRIMEFSRTELSASLLGFEHVHCNFIYSCQHYAS